MTTLHMLTVRTNAALGRLATLQKRADRLVQSTAPVVKPALKELSDALEELQVANEQLHQQVEELTATRQEIYDWRDQFQELLDLLPVACIWTNSEGTIEDINPAAAALLNVSTQHLSGRPLMLFMLERQKFMDALDEITGGQTDIVSMTTTLRPRERRSRTVTVIGRKLRRPNQVCWFLQEAKPEGQVEDGALTAPLSTPE